MAAKSRVRNGHQHARGAKASPYEGLLAELPNPSIALLEGDTPPLWLARLQVAFETAAPEVSNDIPQIWKQSVREAQQQEGQRHVRSLELLFSHFKIDTPKDWLQSYNPDNIWCQLSMALAREHVPAFQVERALEEQGKRRADKPCKLDVYGSACLFLSEYLEKVSKHRPLSAFEKSCALDWATELKRRNLGKSTKRALKRQMLGAHAAYWAGQANDFQRQFVEQVDPLLVEFFSKIAAARAARRCTLGSA
jgi:hypothetical protein